MNSNNNRKGATAAEFAIVLPIILLLVFGAFDLLSSYGVFRTADQGLYLAVRKGTLPGATDEQLMKEFEREVRLLGLEIDKMEIEHNNFQSQESIALKIDIPLEETSWLAPLIFRNRVVRMEYSKTREDYPKNGELTSTLSFPPPKSPGFNVKGR